MTKLSQRTIKTLYNYYKTDYNITYSRRGLISLFINTKQWYPHESDTHSHHSILLAPPAQKSVKSITLHITFIPNCLLKFYNTNHKHWFLKACDH